MKQYDLEERTRKFASSCRQLLYQSSKEVVFSEDAKQLLRSSGSVAANYIESRESLSKKDCIHRLKICKKEAKESHLWLTLLQIRNDLPSNILKQLTQESWELTLIFGSIVSKLNAK